MVKAVSARGLRSSSAGPAGLFRWIAATLVAAIACGTAAEAQNVGKWRRKVVALTNSSYTGNPFELKVDATFTHTASGTRHVLPGYYAGNNVWKIGFMPTLTGQWTWSTSSTDPELNAKTGSLFCVASGLPGMLRADSARPKKWKFTDGSYVVPVALRMEIFSEPATLSAFTATADFLKNNGVHLLETRLLEEKGQFGGRRDFIFSGPWQNHQFDLTIWNRMEQRMEVLTQRGMGAHIMFYSDDAARPGWAGRSATEALVIRYAVARLAGFPNVWFNSGIDIAEYRSQQDVDWWGARIKSLDPYDHPVSSRRGGGSGTIVLAGRLFDSRGDTQSKIATMLSHFSASSVPVSMDDAWGENRPSHPSKNHTPADIRRAFWKALVAGGVGGLVRGGDGYFHIPSVQSDWESEQWVKRVNPFLRDRLGATYGAMVPANILVLNARAIADPARTKILVLVTGASDTWEPTTGPITLKLAGLPDYKASWYDPRSGASTSAGVVRGGANRVMSPPSTGDWVLLLTRDVVITLEDFESGLPPSG